nr:DUF3810 domain-containing protein [Mucilaginibacter straminoryzae]
MVYSKGLFRGVAVIQHLLLGWIPFSIGDILYILLIVYCLVAFVKWLGLLFKGRFRRWGEGILNFIIGFELLLCAFYLLWGINYFRPSAAERLNLQDTAYTLTDVKAVTRMLVDSVNATRAALAPADLHQTNSQIYQTAAEAIKGSKAISPELTGFMPAVKPSLISWLLNYLSTSGYYNPFTGEAQINYQMPLFDRPFTACHEMSHQLGFGREDEANFSGYLAGIHSKDRLLKYSAYYEGTVEFLRYLYRRDSVAHHELKTMLSPQVKQDIKTDSLYWTSYESRIGWLSGLFYDRFLKVNNQPAGLRTYNRMIRLTMAWYRRKKYPKQ